MYSFVPGWYFSFYEGFMTLSALRSPHLRSSQTCLSFHIHISERFAMHTNLSKWHQKRLWCIPLPWEAREKSINDRCGKKGIYHRCPKPQKIKRRVSTLVVYTFRQSREQQKKSSKQQNEITKDRSRAAMRFRKKKEPKPKLFGPDIFGWGGGLPREGGGGRKVRYVPRSQGNQTFLAGYPGILLGYPGGARKV